MSKSNFFAKIYGNRFLKKGSRVYSVLGIKFSSPIFFVPKKIVLLEIVWKTFLKTFRGDPLSRKRGSEAVRSKYPGHIFEYPSLKLKILRKLHILFHEIVENSILSHRISSSLTRTYQIWTDFQSSIETIEKNFQKFI